MDCLTEHESLCRVPPDGFLLIIHHSRPIHGIRYDLTAQSDFFFIFFPFMTLFKITLDFLTIESDLENEFSI